MNALMERYLIKFTKTGGVKFISHLDTLRTLHRALKREEVPISYSKGFNPHPSISIASPLSLGVSSLCEYADLEMEEYMDEKELVDRLNSSLPEGIRVLEALNIKEKRPSSMGIVEGSSYSIILEHNSDKKTIEEIIDKILSKDEIHRSKKSKSGEKIVDIRPLIINIKLENIEKNKVQIGCTLKTGSRASLNPDMLVELLFEFSDSKIFGYPDIVRRDIYCTNNGKLVDLMSYFSGK